jgi:hypothetical protein
VNKQVHQCTCKTLENCIAVIVVHTCKLTTSSAGRGESSWSDAYWRILRGIICISLTRYVVHQPVCSTNLRVCSTRLCLSRGNLTKKYVFAGIDMAVTGHLAQKLKLPKWLKLGISGLKNIVKIRDYAL